MLKGIEVGLQLTHSEMVSQSGKVLYKHPSAKSSNPTLWAGLEVTLIWRREYQVFKG